MIVMGRVERRMIRMRLNGMRQEVDSKEMHNEMSDCDF